MADGVLSAEAADASWRRPAMAGGEVADPVVAAVQADLARRSALGVRKYGTTLARTDLSRRDWIQHAYEEALDLACYLRRLLDEEPRREATGLDYRGG